MATVLLVGLRMRHLVRHLAILACLALMGSVAHGQAFRLKAKKAQVTKPAKAAKAAPAKRVKTPAKDRRARQTVRKIDDIEIYLADEVEADDDAATESADSKPARKAKHASKAHVDEDDEDDEDETSSRKASHKAKKIDHASADDDEGDDDEGDGDDDTSPRTAKKSDRVALGASDRDTGTEDEDEDEDEDDDEDDVDVISPAKLVKAAAPKRAKDWSVAIGPYLWASSVDADISVGSMTVDSGVDFSEMSRHAKFGAEILVDVRYRKFSFGGDVLFGVVALEGTSDVGPVMVSLAGEASSLNVDGLGGYTVLGTEQSKVSLEARVGVRYQRTAIAGTVGVEGEAVANPGQVMSSTDGLAGARLYLRPLRWFFLSGNADIGVVGSSSKTWSAAADASVKITSHVLLSLGYRTLTLEGDAVSLRMHGPRAALQLTF